jgi:hypothetical protein
VVTGDVTSPTTAIIVETMGLKCPPEIGCVAETRTYKRAAWNSITCHGIRMAVSPASIEDLATAEQLAKLNMTCTIYTE